MGGWVSGWVHKIKGYEALLDVNAILISLIARNLMGGEKW